MTASFEFLDRFLEPVQEVKICGIHDVKQAPAKADAGISPRRRAMKPPGLPPQRAKALAGDSNGCGPDDDQVEFFHRFLKAASVGSLFGSFQTAGFLRANKLQRAIAGPDSPEYYHRSRVSCPDFPQNPVFASEMLTKAALSRTVHPFISAPANACRAARIFLARLPAWRQDGNTLSV